MSATLNGNLWEYNMARVVIVDVTDDYRLMRGPLPPECYPVLMETWLPIVSMPKGLTQSLLAEYLYDWHQTPSLEIGPWYVGVVHRSALDLAREPLHPGAAAV